MNVKSVIALGIIWIVSGVVAIAMKDVGVLGYALVGSLIIYLIN